VAVRGRASAVEPQEELEQLEEELEQRVKRCSIYLLYWYRSTNTDAEALCC
jgi:hypothetical protein